MKITIDTQHDTHEDIQKVLKILSSVVEKKEEPVNTAPMMDMFNEPPKEEKAPDFSSFLNLTNNKEEDEKPRDPEISFY